MRKEAVIFLKHILESIEKIEEFTKNLSESEFMKSVKTQDAVIRRLEIIGEAARSIPNKFKFEYPNIPWRKISGLRDVLIHEYFGVDLKLIFRIIKKDLPRLKKDVLEILKKLNMRR